MRVLSHLRAEYALGHLGIRTLEHRIATAVAASTPAGLADATWDLPRRDHLLRGLLDCRLPWTRRARRCSRVNFRLAPGPLSIDLGDEHRTWSIGRSSSCDIVCRDPRVSRLHALLSTRGGASSIRDLGSTNGLYLNGNPVDTAILRVGDVISLGGAVEAEVA